MADTNSEQDARAAFTAATGTVTPAAAKAFAEQMKARGLDPGPALRANGFADQEHSENQEATLDGNSDDGLVDPNRTNTGYLNPATKTPNFSALEAEKAYDTWTKMGLPEEQIKAALEAEGFQHVESGERDASDLENQFDAGFGGAAPGDYDLNGVYLGYETAPSELVGIDRDMRTMLGAMAYPNAAAKSLVADMLDASATGYVSLTNDAAKATYSQEQITIAMRATGATSREDLFDTVRVAFARIPQAIKMGLAERGVFEDGRVLSQLFRHGERLILRAGMKTRR